MNRSFRSVFTSALAGVLVLGASASALASDWDVDAAHSHIGFAVKHMMISTVKGEFGKYSGTVTLDDGGDLTKAKAHLAIDEHLKSPDFFDAAHFPTLTFDSTKVEKHGANGLLITGNLTIKNITKPVVLTVSDLSGEVKDPWGGTRRGATATAKINRKDFGLTWNKALEAGGVVVGDDVNLEFEVELAKKK
jgi:polyisoprenoid-binding protein YceI